MSIHPVTVFLRGHAFTHSDEVVVSPPFSMADKIWSSSTDAQRRATPHGLNALAWQFWHMACSEDEGLALVAGVPRLFDEEGWGDRMGFQRPDAHGMTQAEAQSLAEMIDLDAVWAYRNAVGKRTRVLMETRGLDTWLSPLTQPDLDRAVALGVIAAPAAESMAGFLLGLAKEDLLNWWALNHSLLHLGEANVLLKLAAQKGSQS